MDATDALVVDESRAVHPQRAHRLALLDCPDLLETARGMADQVTLSCDDLAPLPALGSESSPSTGPEDALAGADLVWLRLPKSLSALDEYAELIARHAAPEVRVVAGGRVKFMTHSMNEVLAAHFDSVTASLGRAKSRVLHASGPRAGESTWPRSQHHADLDLTLVTHGATFGGTKIDPGTRLLLAQLPDLTRELPGAEAPLRVLDLGCGNGTIACTLARQQPHWQVLASDVSDAAVRATRASAAANGVQVDARQVDGLFDWPDADLDLIVTNPPFHVGTAKDSSVALAMFEQARRVLRPGGQLWCVYNSHLPWRARLRELTGPTELVAQNPKFTVTRTIVR